MILPEANAPQLCAWRTARLFVVEPVDCHSQFVLSDELLHRRFNLPHIVLAVVAHSDDDDQLRQALLGAHAQSLLEGVDGLGGVQAVQVDGVRSVVLVVVGEVGGGCGGVASLHRGSLGLALVAEALGRGLVAAVPGGLALRQQVAAPLGVHASLEALRVARGGGRGKLARSAERRRSASALAAVRDCIVVAMRRLLLLLLMRLLLLLVWLLWLCAARVGSTLLLLLLLRRLLLLIASAANGHALTHGESERGGK